MGLPIFEEGKQPSETLRHSTKFMQMRRESMEAELELIRADIDARIEASIKKGEPLNAPIAAILEPDAAYFISKELTAKGYFVGVACDGKLVYLTIRVRAV